jgi:hypothetical protein
MALVYAAAKDWDAATALLQRLAAGSDAQVAEAAHNDLQDLPYLMKYGVAPVHAAAASSATSSAPSSAAPTTAKPTPPAATPPARKPASASATAKSSPAADLSDEISETASEPVVDKRPIHYLKGKLISVDCSQPPVAVVIFSSGAKTLTLKTPDYKSITLVGADAFSCAWANRQVSVNYKAVGTDTGDLVSLEVR